jgi:hypothetical protein
MAYGTRLPDLAHPSVDLRCCVAPMVGELVQETKSTPGISNNNVARPSSFVCFGATEDGYC